MGLKVWLPLNGDLQNLGTAENTNTLPASYTWAPTGKIGSSALYTKTRQAELFFPDLVGVSTYTVAYWVYIPTDQTPTAYADIWEIIFDCNGTNVLERDERRSTTDSNHAYHMAKVSAAGNNTNAYYGLGNRATAADAWAHMALTKNDSRFTLYENGIQIGSWPALNIENTPRTMTGIVRLGDNGAETYLQDFRIYDECLSVAQVHEIAKGLVLHYKLDNNGMGNKNLALNSRTFSNWTAGGNWTHSTENGATVYHYERTGATSASWNRLIPPLQLNPENYLNGITVSFDFKCDDISAIDHKCLCSLQVYRADDVRVGWYEPTWDLSQVTDNKWIRLSRHFPYSALKTNYNSSYPNAEIAYTKVSFQLCKNGSIYIKNVKIEDGAVATSYFVAPEDLGLDATIITDSSGYGHHGTIGGTVNIVVDSSRYSSSTNLLASTSYIQVSPYLANEQTLEAITVSCWFKTNTLNDTTPNIFSLGNNAFLRSRIQSATSIWSYYRVNSTQQSKTYSSKNLIDNNWHLLTFVFNSGVASVYIDGEMIGTTTHSDNFLTCASQDWYLGGYWGTSEAFIGELSDFRIYCTPLLDTDIKLLYNIGSRIDNLGGIHTYEANENDNNTISKITEVGQLKSKNIYEQTILLNNATSASYNPNGNSNSCLPSVLWADFSPFYQLGQPIRVKVEADIAWSNITPTGSGTFSSKLQGGNYNATSNTWVWTPGPTNVVSDYNFTSLMTENATGSVHVSYERTVTAAWLEQNLRSQFGLRTDYATGTISISNLKITLISGTAKINTNYVSGTEIIEM